LWTDIDWDRRSPSLTVRSESAKTGVQRIIPLNSVALTTLKEWRSLGDGIGLVFKGKTGGRFDNMRRSFAAVLVEAQITDFSWHCLRHSFASRLVQSGVNVYEVQRLMGHSSIKVTERYAHLNDTVLASAVDVLTRPRPKKKTAQTAKNRKKM
jgi:integrase